MNAGTLYFGAFVMVILAIWRVEPAYVAAAGTLFYIGLAAQ